jgi:putative Mg2+ transporter-C (MgtC) family protein
MWTLFRLDAYFTELTTRKLAFYFLTLAFVALVTIISLFEPFLTVAFIKCENIDSGKIFSNPMFVYDRCKYERFPVLLFMTPDECSFARRIIASVMLGGLIGWERREADRPAGIRTMSLVSLGSCLFTINSAFAFVTGPMSWDASRISAAIPSGVGFLGAGLIFKEAEKDEKGSINHVVHGLTTSASLWLSSAVGVACGGGLYFSAIFCTAVMLILLRFGPRAHSDTMDKCLKEENLEKQHMSVHADGPLVKKYSTLAVQAGSVDNIVDDNSEASSLLPDSNSPLKSFKLSKRRLPNLGSVI